MSNLQCTAAFVAVVTMPKIALFAVTTIAFAAIARLLRGVTTAGSVAGGVVCFLLMLAAGWGGFAVLCAVFLMTWTATRLGYRRKQELGTAERRGGRNAGQVLANLGIAATAALLYVFLQDSRWLMALSAALTEVAADTLSSEIGLVLGGTPRLITTWKAVPAGTDGAITWPGTLAGMCAAVLVSAVCALTGVFPMRALGVCIAAGMLGTIADSVLGATIEREGLLGNNAVNFLSTAVAAGTAWALAGWILNP